MCRAYLAAFLRMRENYWIQYRNGVLDESTWESYKQPLSSVVLDSEFGRNLWRSAAAGSALEPGFRKLMDELLETTKTRKVCE